MSRRDFDPDATFERIRSRRDRKTPPATRARAVAQRRKAKRTEDRRAQLGLVRP